MSNVLMCDSCGTVQSRAAARPEGWLSVRTLADLSHVVPDTHPLHHERHLCSLGCLHRFAEAVRAGDAVPAQLSERATDAVIRPLSAPATQPTAARVRPPTNEGAQLRTAATSPADAVEVESAAAVATPDVVREDAPEGTVVRLSDLIAAKLAAGEVATVDLADIAAKPAVRRRFR